MHHLVIGEGQIGREIIEQALAQGDTVTVLRRSASTRQDPPGLRRVRGDVLDPQVIGRAIEGADAVQACFHAPYDARIWRRDLPPRERIVLDAAQAAGVPVVFPESMYAYLGGAADLHEGAEFSPREEKGRVRELLLRARAAHGAQTLSVLASDLLGPTSIGTWASVACAMVIEPIVAGRRPLIPGALDAPHSLTFIPDQAAAMLHAARQASSLPQDAILHAPSAPPRSMRELAEHVQRTVGAHPRAPWSIPRLALRAARPVSAMMREVSRIEAIWYGPCRLAPGMLETEHGLRATTWEDAVDQTSAAARSAHLTQAA